MCIPTVISSKIFNLVSFTSCFLFFFFLAIFNFSLFLIYLFFSCVGSSLLHTGFLQLRRTGATLHCSARASHCSGFSCCKAQALERAGFGSCGTWTQQLWLSGSRAQTQQLWRAGLVAPWHVGSSQTRPRTRVPCTGRQILNHCTTREVHHFLNTIYFKQRVKKNQV